MRKVQAHHAINDFLRPRKTSKKHVIYHINQEKTTRRSQTKFMKIISNSLLYNRQPLVPTNRTIRTFQRAGALKVLNTFNVSLEKSVFFKNNCNKTTSAFKLKKYYYTNK